MINIYDEKKRFIKDVIDSSKMKFEIVMECFDGTFYSEEMLITKHNVKAKIPSINKKEAELLLSVGYQVNN